MRQNPPDRDDRNRANLLAATQTSIEDDRRLKRDCAAVTCSRSPPQHTALPRVPPLDDVPLDCLRQSLSSKRQNSGVGVVVKRFEQQPSTRPNMHNADGRKSNSEQRSTTVEQRAAKRDRCTDRIRFARHCFSAARASYGCCSSVAVSPAAVCALSRQRRRRLPCFCGERSD